MHIAAHDDQTAKPISKSMQMALKTKTIKNNMHIATTRGQTAQATRRTMQLALKPKICK